MLITLEGIDGSGKTSAQEFLQERRADVDATLTFTREPTETWYGEAVQRSIRDDDADPMAELFLYTADHAAHLAKTVRPALDRGEVVISDRYSDSRYAYQGATLADRLDEPLAFVREIHQPWTRPPDATIYLDVDAQTGAKRSGATNKFERTEQLRAVRENYERLIADEPERFVRIDATRSPEAVCESVKETVESLLETQ
ncbi:dTMP kinase [Halorhabdus sp. CBA1104]|uniref:dTMP kinase n=1 Tax=unclassified Halorhabdus TaxID=2621901 RepID=UPI0012B23BEF|nr:MULTISPECIES: dTMP kinase [unclassified Halorhabdus]QGN07436.1 dTMP kinase [Halorhabdus sp. CBA1104]